MSISDNCYQWLMNMQDFDVEESFWNKLSKEEQAQFRALREKNLAGYEEYKQLKEIKEYFVSSFEVLPLPMAIKDRNRKLMFVNEEYKKIVRMHQAHDENSAGKGHEEGQVEITNLANFSDETKESFLENCKYAIEHCAIVQQEFTLGRGVDQQNYIYWLTGFETSDKKRGLVSIYYDDSFFQSILKRLNRKIVDLEKEQQNIIRNSSLDPLTGAYNRQVLSGFLEEAMKNAKEMGKSFSLLMIDIDHFKQVNDTYGHLIGDQVLQLLVMLLQKTLRDRDYIVRFGGEEFLIILHDAIFENAHRIAERIRKIVESNMSTPTHQPITISIGVASYHEGEEIKELLQRVDDNLYKAKTSGRNRVVPSE